MSEWNPDPHLSYFGHPRLFAGYNADDNDGDEVDGAGTNWAQWPVLFDSFIDLRVLVLTADMLAAFDTQCPDFTVPCEDQTHQVPAELWALTVGDLWPDYVVQPINTRFPISQQLDTTSARSK